MLLPAQRVILLRGNPKFIDQDYYLFALQSPFVQGKLYSRGTGTTVLGIKQTELRKVEIPLPPLPTQQKIAGILSAYDDLIENNTRRIEILEEMARMLYQEWFVKFRFPGHEAVQFVESELSLIPEGWEVKQIQDLPIKIIDGDRSKNYPKASEFTNEGILFLSTKNINQFKIDLSDSNFISKEKFLSIKKGRVIRLDIIMTTRGSIGKVALFNCTLKDALINAQMLIIRADNLEIDQLYLFYLMSDQEFQQSLKNFASGSAQPQIPIQDLKQIFILCPSFEIQKEFSKIVSNNVEMIKNLQEKNINLRKTRDLLLPRLISGEIDVENLAINTGIKQ
jgi:type I restriction enzyme S subunit